MLLEALCAHLTSNAGFSAIAADRLYPALAPQDVPYPMATYNLDSDEPDRLLAGTNGSLRFAYVAVDCYAPLLSDAYDLARAVEAALVDVHGTIGDLSPPQEVDNIRVSRPQFMMYETDTRLYRLSLQFALAYYL